MDTQFLCVIIREDVLTIRATPLFCRRYAGLRVLGPNIIIKYFTNFYLNMHALYL